MNNHSFRLAKLARLRIDTASNAPHKPLLFLVVLDLAQESAFGPDKDPLSLRTPSGYPGARVRATVPPLAPQLA